MTHKELVDTIAQRLNWKTDKVEEALSATVEILNEKISDGDSVSLLNFGSFETIKENEYIYVDPETEDRFLVPPKIEVLFKPSSVIKQNFQDKKND